MLEIADQIDTMSLEYQQAYSLCVAERMFVVKSHFVEEFEAASIDGLLRVLDELWQYVIYEEEMAVDEQEKLRSIVNIARPSKQKNEDAFPVRDICWMIKSVLNVFRGREHAYEIARLGIELATQSQLSEMTEIENQLSIVRELKSFPQLSAKAVRKLREYIKKLPLHSGENLPAEPRD